VTENKDSKHAGLVVRSTLAKTKDELDFEEYQRQLELAIENH
jgi:hypothetical protein